MLYVHVSAYISITTVKRLRLADIILPIRKAKGPFKGSGKNSRPLLLFGIKDPKFYIFWKKNSEGFVDIWCRGMTLKIRIVLFFNTKKNQRIFLWTFLLTSGLTYSLTMLANLSLLTNVILNYVLHTYL